MLLGFISPELQQFLGNFPMKGLSHDLSYGCVEKVFLPQDHNLIVGLFFDKMTTSLAKDFI
jgi:hypothetical protein